LCTANKGTTICGALKEKKGCHFHQEKKRGGGDQAPEGENRPSGSTKNYAKEPWWLAETKSGGKKKKRPRREGNESKEKHASHQQTGRVVLRERKG